MDLFDPSPSADIQHSEIERGKTHRSSLLVGGSHAIRCPPNATPGYLIERILSAAYINLIRG